MDVATLLDNFDVLADASNGIPKLRALILQLAVQGKLVAQDSSDEPASNLLKKITVERNRLIADGTIRRKPRTATNDNSTQCWQIPSTWEWSRIDEVCHDLGQMTPESQFTYIDVGSINRADGTIDDELSVLSPSEAPSRARKIVTMNTVIYSTVRPYLLNVAAIERKISPTPIVSTAFAVLHPYAGVVSRFIYLYLRSPQFTRFVESEMTGIAYPAITEGKFRVLPFPLPPVAEQKRIVAKVDQLMALCGELKEQQNAKRTARVVLNNACLDRLLTSQKASEFSHHWGRVRDNFDLLYDNPANVGQLRQAILQLAVMGKLVPQDPNDELEDNSLDAPKKQEGKRPKWAGPIEDEEKPFQLPSSWAWFRLGDISSLKHGYAFSSKFFTSEPKDFVLTTPGNFYEKGGFRDRESKRKYYSGPVDPQFVLKHGDLIIPMTEQAAGLLGSPAFIPDDGRVYLHNQRLGKLSFSKSISPEFAFWFFNCEYFRSELARTCTGMKVRHTSPDRVLRVPVPVPPSAEQERIVAKVDQMMSLCDELEQQLRKSDSKAETLMESVVHHLAIA